MRIIFSYSLLHVPPSNPRIQQEAFDYILALQGVSRVARNQALKDCTKLLCTVPVATNEHCTVANKHADKAV